MGRGLARGDAQHVDGEPPAYDPAAVTETSASAPGAGSRASSHLGLHGVMHNGQRSGHGSGWRRPPAHRRQHSRCYIDDRLAFAHQYE